MRQSDALSRLTTVPTLWWHWTDGVSILLGAGQSAVDLDLDACAASGVSVLKRSSGGATVYADPALLGLAVALPPNHSLARRDVVESYRWLGETWCDALDALGISSHLVTIDEARHSSLLSQQVQDVLRMACFGSISPYEVLVNGRKLVGLSQVRRRDHTLFQSGIYLSFQPELLTALMHLPDRILAAEQLQKVATDFRSAAGRNGDRAEIIHAFSTALHERHGVTETSGDWSSEELAYVDSAERS